MIIASVLNIIPIKTGIDLTRQDPRCGLYIGLNGIVYNNICAMGQTLPRLENSTEKYGKNYDLLGFQMDQQVLAKRFGTGWRGNRVPSNRKDKESENLRKFHDLKGDLERMRKMKSKVVSLVIEAIGDMSADLRKQLQQKQHLQECISRNI